MQFSTPDYPLRLLIALQEGYCNLKCPMCYVHSPANGQEVVKGIMSLEDMNRILDEFPDPKPTVSPITWAEPLMLKGFDTYLTALKERGFPISLNTNGLLLTPKLAKHMVDIGVDSVFISVDATTPATLEQVRGITNLDDIHQAVHMLLDARGAGKIPRVGVSFTTQSANEHEREEFVEYWLQHVDAVRVAERLDANRTEREIPLPDERIVCGNLYDTLVINHQGEAIMCCLDAVSEVKIGNVFEQGCHSVWQGEAMNRIRTLHETGHAEDISLCRECHMWAGYNVEEHEEDGLLIRRSPVTTFYNNADRLDSWKRDEFDKRYEI